MPVSGASSREVAGLKSALPFHWFDPRTGEFKDKGEVSPETPASTAPSVDPWTLLVGRICTEPRFDSMFGSARGSPLQSSEADTLAARWLWLEFLQEI